MRLQFHLRYTINVGAISAADFFGENESSRSSQGERLAILPFPEAVFSIDVHYPILLVGYTAAGIGYGDDVIEFLANIDRDDYLTPLSEQGPPSKDGIGSLLGSGG